MSYWSLILASLLAIVSLPAHAADLPLRIMSFNIRLPVESDGVDYWETRKPLAVKVLREQEPDVIGLDPATGQFTYCDCAAESPIGRRSLCYDRQVLEARKENKPAGSLVAPDLEPTL